MRLAIVVAVGLSLGQFGGRAWPAPVSLRGANGSFSAAAVSRPAPPSAPASGPESSPGQWQARCPATPEEAAWAQTLVLLVNRARANPAFRAETDGRAWALTWDDRLADVARCHSRDMAAHNYLGHRDSAGLDPFQRMQRAGLGFSRAAENVAEAQSVTRAEALFMAEPRFQPNHRANILNPNYRFIGVGVVRAGSGQLFITQDFLSPAVDQ